jgi:aldehyde dehydrogenase (NAD+)
MQTTSTQTIEEQVKHVQHYARTAVTAELDWRIAQLQQVKRMLIENENAFIQGLHQDLAKPKQEAWTTEIGYVLSEIKHTVKHLKKWMKPRPVSTPLVAQPAKSYIRPEPLGTVLIIGAWNYPIQLTLGPLVAAIAAGNCVVIKPSELAAHSSELLAKLIPQYLDNQGICVIEGAVDETTELLQQPFDHILYTGGEAVAKIVMSAAAKHLTPVTLELGGKSPCIVDSTADIEVAAARIAWSKWTNAGQTCVAPDYLIVERSQVNKLVDTLKAKISAFYGKSIETSPDYGRIINQAHYQRLTHYLTEQPVLVGGQVNPESRYIAPTIVVDPNPDSALMQEEIFGPILPIICVDQIAQAIPIIKQKPKPLALYLFTQDTEFEHKVVSQTQSGNVCINDGMMFLANPSLPFGGVGNSGMGQYHGKTGFDTFSHLKSIMKRANWIDPVLRYPPFSKLKLGLIKRLL